MADFPLSPELAALETLILDSPHTDEQVKQLRQLIKDAAAKEDGRIIIKIAKEVLQCGIDIEKGKFQRKEGKQ